MIRRFVAWFVGAPPVRPSSCLACAAKDETIRVLSSQLDYTRAELTAFYERCDLAAPKAPPVSKPEPPALQPPRGAERAPTSGRRIVPWMQSLAAGGHIDAARGRAAMDERAREYEEQQGVVAPSGHDEGFGAEVKP